MSQAITATSLSDLGEVPVVVPVNRPDGQVVNVPLRTLSEDRMREIRASVKWPEPPVKDLKKIGGEVVPLYDRLEAGYLAADKAADALLSYKVLLASLTIPIPGETEDEQIAALRSGLGAYAFSVLITAINRINIVSAEEIAAIARSFRPARNNGASGNGTAGADPLTMADAAAEREARNAGLPESAGRGAGRATGADRGEGSE